MKKPILLLCCLILALLTYAQPPQKMSYQTVIRNATDDLVSNTTVGMQISVLQGSSSGTAVYVETHAPMTNANGLASLEIGAGTPVTGTMEAIDWGSGPYFLKSDVDIDGGTNYTLSLVSELLSVPYALHSFSSGDGQWSESGSGINTSSFTVGINSPTPEHTLDVRSLSQAEAAGLNVSNDDKSRYVRLFSGSETFPDPSMSWAPGHDLLFATFDDNTFDFSEKMRISSTGDVGIGTATPIAQLHVVEDEITLDAVIYGENTYQGNIDKYGVRGRSVNAPGYGYGGHFEGGYIGVDGFANSTTYNDFPTYGLKGTATGTAGIRVGVQGVASNPGGQTAYGVYGISNGATDNFGVFGNASGGTTNWAGYFSGDVRITGTLDNTSDARLKKDIVNLENALEIIKRLEPKAYEFRTDEFPQMGLDKRPQLGFIAQDMEQVLPQLVRTAIHPEFQKDEREESDIPDSPDMDVKSINYIGIIPVLTQGIKELASEVEAKGEAIEQLKAENLRQAAMIEENSALIEANADLKSEIEKIKKSLDID